MRVLISRISWQPRSLGGAETSALAHARLLCDMGHEAQMVGNLMPRENQPYFKHIFMPRNKLIGQLVSFIYFPLLALLWRPDIINPHSRFDQIAFSFSKWLHRRPVVWKDPGDLESQIQLSRTSLLARLNQWLLIGAMHRADSIYTLNENDRHTLLERLEKLSRPINPDRIAVIRSDILFEDFDLTAKPAKKTSRLVVGYVGRIDQRKGPQYLLEAFIKLNDPGTELWVIGNGPCYEQLEAMARGADNIILWGYKTDYSAYLRGMDVFVQPAEQEGWGRTIKEAMYFSLPIVGSNVGGIAAQIEDGRTGLLFEPKNVAELTEQLHRLIKDAKLRRKLGSNAHKKAVADGDFRVVMRDQILPLFASF